MGWIEAKADRLVGELAHGDQRVAEISMALALQPHLLLLDEPTAGMGDQETYEITQLIRRLHRDKMLSIGRAPLLNPKLLILDEPSQGLAPLIVREVFRVVSQMRSEGISVLLVEQNARIGLEIADHAYVLDDGALVYSGPARELAADEARVQALAGASAEEWTQD